MCNSSACLNQPKVVYNASYVQIVGERLSQCVEEEVWYIQYRYNEKCLKAGCGDARL